MNVEVDHLEGQIALTILAHDAFDHRIRIVTVAALLNAQRPERHHWHMAGEISVTGKDLLDRWTVEKIIVELSTLSPEPNALLGQPSKFEIAPITVVEKNSVSCAVL